MPAETCDWYDTPLYYDIIFDDDTATEATFLEVMHLRHGRGTSSKSRTLLEPACGSGRLMVEMARRGWIASGFDANEAMLEHARERLKSIHLTGKLWQDRMERFQLTGRKQFDLAHCLVSTFKYLQTESDALGCLQRVADALKPGGIFVLGLHLSDYTKQAITHERWVASRDGIHVVCNTRTWPANRAKRTEAMRNRLRITFPDGRIRNQETLWEFRTYSAAQLRALLKKVPQLNLVACHDFHCDPDSTRKLDDSYADIVLILKRT